jgi:hypothetical protein
MPLPPCERRSKPGEPGIRRNARWAVRVPTPARRYLRSTTLTANGICQQQSDRRAWSRTQSSRGRVSSGARMFAPIPLQHTLARADKVEYHTI